MIVKLNKKILQRNKLYDYNIFKNHELKIDFNKEKNKIYTILNIDKDAPSKKNPVDKYHIHEFIINMVNNDYNTVLCYKPPNPPKGSGDHEYCIYILEQDSKYKYNAESRIKFDFENFVKNKNLKIVDKFCFRAINE